MVDVHQEAGRRAHGGETVRSDLTAERLIEVGAAVGAAVRAANVDLRSVSAAPIPLRVEILDFSTTSVDTGAMPKTVPLSDLSRRTTEITAQLDDDDVILGRRDAADLYLSTRARHEREVQGLRVTTRTLARLAAERPDLAGDALMDTLPWMAWLTGDDQAGCLRELLRDLRAGAETGELLPFTISLAAWESTAIALASPEIADALRDAGTHQGDANEQMAIARPTA